MICDKLNNFKQVKEERKVFVLYFQAKQVHETVMRISQGFFFS